MSIDQTPRPQQTFTTGGIIVAVGLVGAAVALLLWMTEREERRPNYAATIVVLVISAFIVLCGVVLHAGRQRER